MKPNQTPSIVAYGAAAEPALPLTPWQRTRTALKHAHYLSRDQARWKSGDLSQLDYRNYQNATSVNRGDQAIVDSITSKIAAQMNGVDFIHKNWGTLASIPTTSAMVAVCGSGYLALNKDNELSRSTANDLEFLLTNDIALALVGIGINQNLGPQDQADGEFSPSDVPVVRTLLERCDLISVRDWRTHRALQRLTDKPVHMVADAALYYAPAHPPGTGRPAGADRPLKVGFNLPFHGPKANERVRQDLPKYVELLKAIHAQSGCEFHYMTHYEPEKVVARLMQDAGICMTVADGPPDQLLHAYQQLDLHIGGMLHSCILATSCGVPCIGLAYDVKHSGFFDVMQMPAQCVSAIHFDIANTLSVFNAVRADLSAIQARIGERRAVLEQEFDRFVRQAVELLDAPRGVAHA